MARTLVSSWGVLEEQITIVLEATSHEKNRRGRRPLRVGPRESLDISVGRSCTVTTSKLRSSGKIAHESAQVEAGPTRSYYGLPTTLVTLVPARCTLKRAPLTAIEVLAARSSFCDVTHGVIEHGA